LTHFGVISLLSSNFQNFNTFRPLFQKLQETDGKLKLETCSACQDLHNKGRKLSKFRKFDEKGAITPKWVRDLLKNCKVDRSRHGAHFCAILK
jgi:hypothetical protein